MESHTIPWFQTTNQLLTISLQTSLYYMFFLGYCGSKPWCPNTKIVKTKKVYGCCFGYIIFLSNMVLICFDPSSHHFFSWRFQQYLFTKKLHLEIQKVKLKSPRSFETSHLASCFISGIVPENWSNRLLHLVHDRRGSIEERPELLTDEFSASDVGILCRTEILYNGKIPCKWIDNFGGTPILGYFRQPPYGDSIVTTTDWG